ncbi:MAG: CoA transferase subunit A [Acidobacteriaceae bacterium]|nr:CoA transferase subunit A [Acidobacteriaceae bacterium]
MRERNTRSIQITSLREAIAEAVHDGDTLAMEGFTHLIPFAAGHEIIRQAKKNLTLVRMTPDLIYDQMIGMGCACKLIFSWGGNPGVGSLHRFRDAIQTGWPDPLEIEEHSHADMAARYQAGASGLPFALIRGYIGSDLPKYNRNIKSVACPFTGEILAATPALAPDVAIIHAQKADRKGNVLISGIIGIQKEAVLCSKRAIVTVEEIVDDLNGPMNSCVLPHWCLTYVCVVPGGAHPSYAHGYYKRDNAFCKAWDGISKDRDQFRDWMNQHVLSTSDFAEFKRSLAGAAVTVNV